MRGHTLNASGSISQPGAWSLLVTVLLECLKKTSLLYLLPLARLIQRPANVLQVQAGLAVLTRRRLHQFCCFFLFLHFFLPFLAEVAGQSLRSSNERVLLL